VKVPGVAEVRVKGGTGRLFKEALLASRVEGGQSRPVAASRGQWQPVAASHYHLRPVTRNLLVFLRFKQERESCFCAEGTACDKIKKL
jgi:hypothetical protein